MYRKILVFLDNSSASQTAVAEAIALAQVHRAEIFFLCVVPRYEYPAVDKQPIPESAAEMFDAKSAEDASRLLAAASAKAEKCAVFSHRATALASDSALALAVAVAVAVAVAETAAKHHCDLIVVGTGHHNALIRLVTGDIVPGLISKAQVPVLVCREGVVSPDRYRHLSRPFARVPHRFRSSTLEDGDLYD